MLYTSCLLHVNPITTVQCCTLYKLAASNIVARTIFIILCGVICTREQWTVAILLSAGVRGEGMNSYKNVSEPYYGIFPVLSEHQLPKFLNSVMSGSEAGLSSPLFSWLCRDHRSGQHQLHALPTHSASKTTYYQFQSTQVWLLYSGHAPQP